MAEGLSAAEIVFPDAQPRDLRKLRRSRCDQSPLCPCFTSWPLNVTAFCFRVPCPIPYTHYYIREWPEFGPGASAAVHSTSNRRLGNMDVFWRSLFTCRILPLDLLRVLWGTIDHVVLLGPNNQHCYCHRAGRNTSHTLR